MENQRRFLLPRTFLPALLVLAIALTLALGSPPAPAGAQGDLYLTKTVVNVEEGYMEEFGVGPASQPSHQVIVTIEVVEQVDAVFAVYVMDSYGTTLRCGKGSVCNLRFDPVNWNRVKYVGVSALPDDDNENGSGKIKITTVSDDSDFNGIEKIVDTKEDDQVGVPVPAEKALVVSAGSNIYVNEGGSASYAVRLSQEPDADVTVTLSRTGDSNITFSPASLTFTTENYDTTQSVTLTAAEDDDGLRGTATIAHSASNGGYNNVSKSLTANEVENDKVEFVVSPAPAPLTLTEGGSSHSYTVKLASQPTADVAVAISKTPPDDDGITVSPASLTFATSTWNTAQTVTIAAVEDSDYTADTATVSHAVTTSDTSGYGSQKIGDIVVTAKDNDAALFIDTDPNTDGNQTALALVENGSSATYTVKLSNQPTANVAVTISETQNPSTGNVKVTSSKSLTFTTSNWDTAQTVTVRAQSDTDATNGTPTISHDASGGGFDNVSASVSVSEIDSQMGISTKQNNSNVTAVTVVEQATATYDVSINAKPATNVTVSVVAATTGNYTDEDITVSPASLTFTPQNYNTAQTVTLSAADDIDVADGQRTISHTATYAGKTFTKDITVREDDDDSGGLTFDMNSVNVNENGTGTYKVKLTHKPHGTVYVSVSAGSGDSDISVRDTNDSANGNQTGSIPFTADNYDTYRTVTLAARDDTDSDNGSRTINHTASGGGYSNITGTVTATEMDDDHGFVFSPSSVSVTEQGTATYTVKLATMPSADVTVTIAESTTAPNNDTDITVTSTKTLTFTTQSWNTAQTVTLSAAADNDLADGQRAITHTAASSDSKYNNKEASLTATEDDNDTGGLEFNPAIVGVNENGTGTYQVRLTHKPNGNVNVSVSAATGGSNDSDITVRDTNDSANGNQTGSIPFTADNWNTYRTVTLAARDDADSNVGSRTINHTANGGGYSNVTGSVTANEVDDEHGVILSVSSLSVDEGSTATYTVKLATPPTHDVTVAVAAATGGNNDTDITVSPASLSFTSTTYSTALTVTLSAEQDSDRFDGSRTITHTATSSDSNYNNLSVSLTATEDDDDSAHGRDTARELDLATANSDPWDIWSNGTTMWVLDRQDKKLYAYTLATGAADISKDISLNSNNGSPRGIWSDGKTIWVADNTSSNNLKAYAYTLSSGTRDTAKEFSLSSYNRDPRSMWSDGTTLWVANNGSWGADRVWAYNLATGALDTSRSFELDAANADTFGIWSDGTTLWVADSRDAKPYAYTLVNGTRDTTSEFSLHTDNGDPYGIWSNGTTMWVLDYTDGKVYAYHAPKMTQRLTADDATASSMRVTIAWHPENWYYKHTTPSGGQCSGAVGTASTRATGLSLNRAHTFAAYSDSSCATMLTTANTLETKGSHLALSNFSKTTNTYDVTLTLANWDTGKDGNWSYKTNLSGARGACVAATANPATVDDFSFSANENHVFSAYRGSTCSGTAIASAPRFSPSAGIPALTAGSIKLSGATLTLSNYTGTWWQNSNYGATGCTRVGSATTTATLSKLTPDTSHTYHAFSASGCQQSKTIASVSFTTAAPGERITAKDFSLNSNNYNPRQAWSNGTTLWVLDLDLKLYAYTLTTGAHDASKKITLHTDNSDPSGIWSDGTTMWVGDASDDKLYAYTLADGTRNTSKEFNLASSNNNQSIEDNGYSAGMWSDGMTMWVGDRDDYKVYAYTLAGGTRNTAKEFSLATTNNYATDYWSDGVTMYVAENDSTLGSDRKVYAYTLATGARDTDKEFVLLPNPRNEIYPEGIWSDGTTMWVVDSSYTRVVAYYAYPIIPALTAGSITLTGATLTLNHYTGAWWHNSDYGSAGCTRVSAGTDTAILEDLTLDTPYTYHAFSASGCKQTDKIASVSFTTAAPGDRITNKDLSLDSNNYNPRQIWSDGTTLWVVDITSNNVKLYAYTLATGARDTDKEFNLHADNTRPGGIWSDGATMWVVEEETNDYKLYAYTLATGARDTSKEFNLYTGLNLPNDAPVGIWSDGVTMWVGDRNSKWVNSTDKYKIYAYTLATGARDESKEFYLDDNNNYTKDFWSDGTTLWVVEYDGSTDRKLYAYNLETGKRDKSKEFDDFVSDDANQPVGPNGIWSDGATLWVADGDYSKMYAYHMYPPTKRLRASGIGKSGATLNITWHDEDWWYKRIAPTGDSSSCKVTAGTITATLSSLNYGTEYTYNAYDESGCNADSIASVTFSTTSLTADDISATTMRLAITHHTGDWYYKHTSPSGGQCSEKVTGASTRATGLDAGQEYTFTAYSNSACTTLLTRAIPVSTLQPTLTAEAGSEVGAVTLKLTDGWVITEWLSVPPWSVNKDGTWHVKYTTPVGGVCSTPQMAESGSPPVPYATVTALAGGVAHTFAAYSDSACTNLVATAAPVTPASGGAGGADGAGGAFGPRFQIQESQGQQQQPDDPAIVPDAPASVSASRSSGNIAVSWSASDGATGYDVEYSTDGQATWQRAVTNQAGTSYTLSSADSTKTYVISVRAVNSAGESGWTNSSPASPPTPETQPPGAVASVSAVHNGGSLSASWSASDGATGYDVEYSTDGQATWQRAATNHVGTSYTLSSADSTKTYVISVRAVNSAGESGWTNSSPASPPTPETQPPGAVASVSAVHNGGSLSVSWTAAEGATGYDVVYSTDGKASWERAATNHAGTSYTLSNADSAKTYVVSVRAVNSAGASGWTDSAPVSPPQPETKPPGAVASVSAVHNGGSLSVSWTAAERAASYHVMYSDDGGQSWLLAAESHPGTSLTIADADAGKTYIVGVQAVNSAGESDWTDSAPATPAAPGTVGSVSVVHHGGSLSVSWTAAERAASYHVTYSDDGGQSWLLAAASHPGTSLTIADADASKTYIVGVRAGNAGGFGGWTNSLPTSPP